MPIRAVWSPSVRCSPRQGGVTHLALDHPDHAVPSAIRLLQAPLTVDRLPYAISAETDFIYLFIY